jgi:hypothetical protein
LVFLLLFLEGHILLFLFCLILLLLAWLLLLQLLLGVLLFALLLDDSAANSFRIADGYWIGNLLHFYLLTFRQFIQVDNFPAAVQKRCVECAHAEGQVVPPALVFVVEEAANLRLVGEGLRASQANKTCGQQKAIDFGSQKKEAFCLKILEDEHEEEEEELDGGDPFNFAHAGQSEADEEERFDSCLLLLLVLLPQEVGEGQVGEEEGEEAGVEGGEVGDERTENGGGGAEVVVIFEEEEGWQQEEGSDEDGGPFSVDGHQGEYHYLQGLHLVVVHMVVINIWTARHQCNKHSEHSHKKQVIEGSRQSP